MNKWLLRTTLSVTLLSQLQVPFASAQASDLLFSDIHQASNWSLDSIAYLNEKGITHGYDDGTYKPRKPITRQEVAELLVRALQLPTSASSVTLPSDVRPSSWSADSIQRVLNQGLMGRPDEPFRPTDVVTREELLSIFVQATGAKGGGTTALPEGEVSSPERKQSIETSLELGLLQGDGRKLDLNKPTERQEIAVFLTRLMDALQEPQNRELELTFVNESIVRIGAFQYPVTDDMKALFTAGNKELLSGSTLKVKLTSGFKIQEIVDLTVPASKSNLTLDGGGLRVSGNITILGDHIKLQHLTVAGKIVAGGAPKTSLELHDVTSNQLELATASQLSLTGNSSIQSLTVSQTAVDGSSIVLKETGEINDIIVPDKRLVPNLVKDYGINQGKIQLINGQPRETQTAASGGSGTSSSSGSSSSGSDSNSSAPVIPTINKIQEVDKAYVLPAQVSVRLDGNTTVNRTVAWTAPEGVQITDGAVHIKVPGVYVFSGKVEGVAEKAQLKLDVRLPLKLTIGNENSNIVVTTPGEAKTITFTSEPLLEVANNVEHISYLFQWTDENGEPSSQAKFIRAEGYEYEKLGNGWLLTKTDDSPTTSKETLSLQVEFGEPGTYSVKITAVKHEHHEY
ncbi:S-layer homology domain-containing protein [Paenibacillus hubeiensis]|uniref:S-layer homology domain-containing protein n=1 Tax=Paenibacillus hubeiensis TaxID=3077330 RepID=UPI0031BA749F